MPRPREQWKIDHDPVYREKYRKWAKRWRQKVNVRNLVFISEYLIEHPCVDCGERDIRFLDFDHVRGQKVKGVSALSRFAVQSPRLLAEIAKCEVRCIKCHRIRHYQNTLTWKIKTRVMRDHNRLSI